MNIVHPAATRAIARAAVVSACGILVGALLYQTSVFVLTMKAFQFTMSSITVAMTYAAIKGNRIRNGLAALLVWYVLLTGLIEEFNSWMLKMNFVYIGGLGLATFLHQKIAATPLGQKAIQRILFAAGLMSIANGLVVVFLGFFAFGTVLTHAGTWIGSVFYNLQLGALIGLGTGCGMEVAEYLNGRFLTGLTGGATSHRIAT